MNDYIVRMNTLVDKRIVRIDWSKFEVIPFYSHLENKATLPLNWHPVDHL